MEMGKQISVLISSPSKGHKLGMKKEKQKFRSNVRFSIFTKNHTFRQVFCL
jgi:hypothetical protein